MTLSKLAKIAHVSVSTVSKAFSASREISAETRKYIFDIAKEQGCFEKYYKENYDKKVIAVLCPELCSEYYSNFATCMEQRLSDADCTTLLSVTDFDLQKEMDILHYYRCFAKVSGMIIMGVNENLPHIEGVPTVGVGCSTQRTDMSTIKINNTGLREAIAHLKEMGHRDIAFFGEPLTAGTEQKFIKILQEQGLRVREECILRSDFRFEKAGEWCAEQILKMENRPTAAIAAYDYIALGAINKLKTAGVRVPQDFSVIGTNNIDATDYKDIRLTSVKTDFEEICDIAMKMLFDKIENPESANRSVEVGTVLVKRDSVAKI